jgi:hypothetical protein
VSTSFVVRNALVPAQAVIPAQAGTQFIKPRAIASVAAPGVTGI